MKETIIELADTGSSSTRGSSIGTVYALEPVVWLRDIIDGAKKMQYFVQVSYTTEVPKGNKDVVVPYRKVYLANAGTFADQTAENTEVSATTMDNLDGLELSPSQHAYSIRLSDYAMQTNAVDLVRAAKEELTYWAADVVDKAISAALAAATTATSSARGAQEIFGGDAYSKATLASGDILTTDLVANAKTRLMSTTVKYWSGSTEGDSSDYKNPWLNTPEEPFVLFIAPENENAFLKDSQFVNASEYGNNDIVLNGEIGRYLGTKIVVTSNTPRFTDGGGASVIGHTCLLLKAKKASALAWGLPPTLKIFDYPSNLQTRIILAMNYATSVFYTDAIVKIWVTDA